MCARVGRDTKNCVEQRITTHRALKRPLSAKEAVDIVESWLGHEQVRTVSPGSNFWTLFKQIVLNCQVAGPLMSDAKLAALALEWGATVCTHDLDFLRFEQIQVEFPLR